MLDSIGRLFANVVTILNIICGTLAIIYTFVHDYQMAAALIILAVIMDALDGRIARRFDSSSDLGKELDSLCDLVSFGVSPAILIFAQVLQSNFRLLGILVILLYVVCGALRLARFNVINIHEYFLGIPITFAGLTVAVLSLLSKLLNPTIIIIIVFSLSLLMISNLKIRKI